MTKNIFELRLVESGTHTILPPTLRNGGEVIRPPPADSALDSDTSNKLRSEAKRQGLSITHDRSIRTSRPRTFGRNVVFHGGMPADVHEILQWTAYSATTLGMLAAFANNVLSAVNKWLELRHGRKVIVKLGNRQIEVKNGEDLQRLIDQHIHVRTKK
jgi:hypothetical protein